MFLHLHIELKKEDPNGNGGCYVKGIGNTGGKQILNLARPGCMKIPNGGISGTVIHEFIHKWGFWHEHARPDRGWIQSGLKLVSQSEQI